MDYLAGRQKSSTLGAKKYQLVNGEDKLHSTFNNFCEKAFAAFGADGKKSLSDEFLSPEIIDVFEDDELNECINEFLKNNLNISETSRNAFLHRNTLLYRVDKVFKLTGLNIRNFEDAMNFKILSMIYEKTKRGLKR